MSSPDIGSQTNDWVAICKRHIPFTTLDSGLVDENGQSTTSLDAAWGIGYTTCLRYCNRTVIPLSLTFDFQGFSQAFTNYFLPWLALTAQLPYETGSPWCNIMSFCMAVGSPALITYSLSITCLNRYWIRKRIEDIRGNHPVIEDKCPNLFERLKHIEYFLSETQQTPLRVSQEHGWLSSLLLDPDNKKWWSDVCSRLKSTRRGITFSLVAQVSSAFVAWIFVIISAFQASLGKPTAALQMSTGSLWIWLVPVISGWIIVGTQYKHSSVKEALQVNSAYRALQSGDRPEMRFSQQSGITTDSGLLKSFTTAHIADGNFREAIPRNDEILFWFGWSVVGDESQQGPSFNYARLFTWYQFAQTLVTASEMAFKSIQKGHDVHYDPNRTGQNTDEAWNVADPDNNLKGDARELARFCGLQLPPYGSPPAYASFTEMFFTAPAQVKNVMVASALMAILVQWGTTGAAIIIAYLTPVKGLGCRSGSYVLYGVASTLGWICLVISMTLSHTAMLMYQHQQVEQAQPGATRSGLRRSLGHSLVCGAAVTTRLAGKIIIICNTGWVIASSLMELIGRDGWALLFKGAADLRDYAAGPWAGGVTMSILTLVISTVIIWLGSMKG